MKKSEIQQIPPYYRGYLDTIPEGELIDLLKGGLNAIRVIELEGEQYDYRYEEGKWTIKEVFQHLIDCERIFNYRALCISRGDSALLPGFDQDKYVENSLVNERLWESIQNEYINLRKSTIDLYSGFTYKQLISKGNANGFEMSVASLGLITVAHQFHHFEILSSKYYVEI